MAQLSAMNAAWNKMPKGLMSYGGGGINSSGAVCGNYNAGEWILKLLGAPKPVTDTYQRWFENTYLPSNAIFVDYTMNNATWEKPAGGWTSFAALPGEGTIPAGLPIPANNAPRVKPLTLTCHGAHTRWKVSAQTWLKAKGSNYNRDRCGKTTYDACYYLCTLINKWKAGDTSFYPGTLDPQVGGTAAGCKQAGCHAAVSGQPTSGYPATGAGGQMICTPCHTQRISDGHNL